MLHSGPLVWNHMCHFCFWVVMLYFFVIYRDNKVSWSWTFMLAVMKAAQETGHSFSEFDSSLWSTAVFKKKCCSGFVPNRATFSLPPSLVSQSHAITLAVRHQVAILPLMRSPQNVISFSRELFANTPLTQGATEHEQFFTRLNYVLKFFN